MAIQRAAVRPATQVEAVRRFNRFYTRQIGVLNEGLLDSPYTLAEARLLYELAHRERPPAAALARDLGLDPGYLSRLLSGLRRRGLLKSAAAKTDRRQSLLSLTRKGRRAFGRLEQRSRAQVGALLGRLDRGSRARLLAGMRAVEFLLNEETPPDREPYVLRPLQAGDLGWVVHRHGALYAQEYGWDERFEALVAHVVAEFVDRYDPKRDRCWMAERDGEIVGSVFLVQHTKTVAKLRLLLVEPSARGLGIGSRLVAECIRFARQAGYRKITLWTNSVLHAARRIYEQTGFKLVKKEPHAMFGAGLVGETWELRL
ncbi:MAG TPA: helix-turn-helix domain-containing GNAT family N-acetyltransferase [Gemmatimonadales bacterium]|nr:helix-turn-helix domain-containing GNAT family N-acetyltransferase [Gemmatimonadales bacterium]